MSDRKKDMIEEEEHKPEGAGGMRWLLTYADMITLLLGLFVILAATQNPDAEKYKIIADQAAAVFGGQPSFYPGGKYIYMGRGYVHPYARPGKKEEPEKKTVEQPAGVTVVETGMGMRITFSSGILFDPGRADLKDESKEIIDKVFELYVRNTKNNIVIKGHTDNKPIKNAVFPSNWELSTGRAGAVARYLLDMGLLTPERITTAGYADTQPIDTNETTEGRAKNRRVEIWVLKGEANKLMNDLNKAAEPEKPAQGKEESEMLQP